MTGLADHPLMQREIVVFMAPLPPGDPKPRFAAFLANGAGFLPIVFRGHSKAAVIEAAEQWRVEEIEREVKREAAKVARVEAAKARRAA